MNDEFYVGWEEKAPPRHAKAIRRFVIAALAAFLVAGLGFAAAQRLIGVAYFEWGDVKTVNGLLRMSPYPHLVLPADKTNRNGVAAPLVAPFKFGVKHEAICGFDGQRVTLRATRIHRDDQLMLEMEPDSVSLEASATRPDVGPDGGTPALATVEAPANPVSLGHHIFHGEIVDSKCWMGVMNPGVLKPHRACATLCISGGIPPMLLVRRPNAQPLNLLLVSTNDLPVNDRVLDFVAEPVAIIGEVVRTGALLTLRIDPATIRRLEPGDGPAEEKAIAP